MSVKGQIKEAAGYVKEEAFENGDSPEAKRFVKGENTNTTNAGKLILHERWELERYEVR